MCTGAVVVGASREVDKVAEVPHEDAFEHLGVVVALWCAVLDEDAVPEEQRAGRL